LESNLFVLLDDAAIGEVRGTVLSPSFDIRIEERTKTVNSELPAVFIKDVEPTVDRHFCQQDKSGCLCSPFLEREFLLPQFSFKRFIEELVVPFLYGQAFYTIEQRWPWDELAHGAMGILESYKESQDRQTIERCLEFLKRESKIWRAVLLVLRHGAHLKGNMKCFCGRGTRITDCHPKALKGASSLRRDIRALGLVFKEDSSK
jgi:hypothetical protein